MRYTNPLLPHRQKSTTSPDVDTRETIEAGMTKQFLPGPVLQAVFLLAETSRSAGRAGLIRSPFSSIRNGRAGLQMKT